MLLAIHLGEMCAIQHTEIHTKSLPLLLFLQGQGRNQRGGSFSHAMLRCPVWNVVTRNTILDKVPLKHYNKKRRCSTDACKQNEDWPVSLRRSDVTTFGFCTWAPPCAKDMPHVHRAVHCKLHRSTVTLVFTRSPQVCLCARDIVMLQWWSGMRWMLFWCQER